MSLYHVPVLLHEVINCLEVKPDKRFIDATIGGGGHAKAILRAGGIVLGIDQDEDAIKEVETKLADYINKCRLIIEKGNFKNLKQIAEKRNFTAVDGIIFDLGVSTYQLETPEKGFSFNSDSPLDMRMDKSLTVTAADLVNGLGKKELYELFTKLGEEQCAWRVSQAIVRARRLKHITLCNELAAIVLSVRRRGKFDRTHPATRIFQALRIAINDELNVLREALPQTIRLLRQDGKILVISFHSLEDRIVKQFIKEQEKLGILRTETEKPIISQAEEIRENPKARSAKMRVAQKI